MPVIVVTSEAAGTGKTGVAAAIARHVAYEGRPARLLRTLGDASSTGDAEFFASLEFVPGSPPSPVAADSIANPRVGTYVVEAGIASVESIPADKIIFVTRRDPPPSLPQGLKPAAVVVVAVDPEASSLPAEVSRVPVVGVPDDRKLAGFSVSDAQRLLKAETLVEADGDATCDDLVVAPFSADAGQPYLRRFERPAVVCRFDRTDMHLAAIRSDPGCLILTGGQRPSDYLFDAARSRGIAVLLSAADTENTVMALENVFEGTRFQGEPKLERMSELLEGTQLPALVLAESEDEEGSGQS